MPASNYQTPQKAKQQAAAIRGSGKKKSASNVGGAAIGGAGG